MIIEAVNLYVEESKQADFESDFKAASQYISAIKGYIKHSLLKCIENKEKYLLYVEWEKLENHTVDFRESDEYQKWKQLLHHYYKPFPIVEHFIPIDESEIKS